MIANTTAFNNQKLLSGSFTNKAFQVGAYSGETVQLSSESTQTTKIGHVTTGDLTLSSAGTAEIAIYSNLQNQYFSIQSVDVLYNNSAENGIGALADAINRLSDVLGISASATVESTTAASIAAGTITDFQINGVAMGDVAVKANDSDGALVTAINQKTSQHGVMASVDGAGFLTLTSTDHRSIQVEGDTASVLGAADLSTLGFVRLNQEGAGSLLISDVGGGTVVSLTDNLEISDSTTTTLASTIANGSTLESGSTLAAGWTTGQDLAGTAFTDDLSTTATSTMYNAGTYFTADTFTLSADLTTTADMTLTTGSTLQSDSTFEAGTVFTADALTLSASFTTTADMTLQTGATLQSNSLFNTGTVFTADDLTLSSVMVVTGDMTLQAGSQIGTGTVLAAGTTIAGANLPLFSSVSITGSMTLGANSTIAQAGTIIGAGSTVGASATLDGDLNVTEDMTLAAASVIRADSILANGSTLGGAVTLTNTETVAANTEMLVATGSTLAAGSVIAEGTYLSTAILNIKGALRMIPAQARDAYRRSATQGTNIAPEKLIHLLYERALKHLRCAGEGIDEQNPRKRGENLGNAIAFVTELNASLDMAKGGETAVFLRGLYEAILVDLSKVSTTNDMEVIKRTCRYLQTLKDIWEQTAMQETAVVTQAAPPVRPGAEAQRPAIVQKFPLPAVMEGEMRGLSVSV